MSMTMIAFYSEAKAPTKAELESEIAKLNYDFKFLEEFEGIDGFAGSCELNGIKTFFETNVESIDEILNAYNFSKKDLSGYDTGISFIWGADFMAGACIGIISSALIELCGAKVVYADDETWYTRQMLLDETPIFIEEHLKLVNKGNSNPSQARVKKKIAWVDWAILGVLLISVVLMKKKLISWHLPLILMVFYIGYGIWKKRKNNRQKLM